MTTRYIGWAKGADDTAVNCGERDSIEAARQAVAASGLPLLEVETVHRAPYMVELSTHERVDPAIRRDKTYALREIGFHGPREHSIALAKLVCRLLNEHEAAEASKPSNAFQAAQQRVSAAHDELAAATQEMLVEYVKLAPVAKQA